jgi:hypothetical protein
MFLGLLLRTGATITAAAGEEERFRAVERCELPRCRGTLFFIGLCGGEHFSDYQGCSSK